MGHFISNQNLLLWQEGQQKLWIQPWGVNGLRVQANLAGSPLDLPQALLPVEPPAVSEFELEIRQDSASIRNGKLRAVVSRAGRVQFLQAVSGKTLLEEPPIEFLPHLTAISNTGMDGSTRSKPGSSPGTARNSTGSASTSTAGWITKAR